MQLSRRKLLAGAGGIGLAAFLAACGTGGTGGNSASSTAAAVADVSESDKSIFWKVTFPLLLPGIVAAALLSFAMSFDDFIITNFNSGNFSNFPKFIYVSATRGIPAQANVIGSAMFILALVVVVTSQVIACRRRKALAARYDPAGHAICSTNRW